MQDVLASFVIQDHLAHRWTDELVGFKIDRASDGKELAVRNDKGTLLPCQLAQRGGSNAGKPETFVHFVIDELPSLSTRRFSFVAQRAVGQGPSARVLGDTIELGNGLITVRVPASQKLNGKVPAPILGVRRGEGEWLGEGRLFLSPHLKPTALVTSEVESGPLWITWLLEYQFEGGERYRVTLKLFTGRSNVEVTEESSLCRDSHWEFSLRAGLAPDRTWTHPHQVLPQNPQRLKTIDYAAATEKTTNLGSVQMPCYSGIWVPDDYYYFSFFGKRDAVSALGVNGGFWDYPYENQIDIQIGPDRDAYFCLSIKAGHRRWLLHVADPQEILAANPFNECSIHRATKKYETPLDKVKDLVLAWDNTAEPARPFAIANRQQLDATSAKAKRYAKFNEYVASLNPDLPGDFTYYHAGTHRVFEANHRNDPAVLYVTAETDAERKKQAAFLKDVVMTGLASRRSHMLEGVGHLGHNSASINVGRGLRPWAALYDLASAEGVFSAEEDKLARATFAFYCYKINDPDYWPADHLTFRDDHPRSAHRTHWFPMRQNDWCFYNIDNIPHNFHGDLWSAAGCIAMVFPTHPESRRWVDRTLEFWESELTYWVFPGGAWLESSTYVLNSMKDYLIYCRMLSNSHIRDYFTDERLQRAFTAIAEHLGPFDKRIGGTTLPVMGDGSYPNVFCYVLGWMGGLAKTAPDFAAKMNQAWKTTGEYLTEPGRFGLNFCDFLFIDPFAPTQQLPALGSKWYTGLGAILRHAQRTPEEIYLFIKAGIIYSHFHEPEGTFQLWWDSVPLCDEYGVQYGTGVNGVSTSHPSAHNCVAVQGESLAYNKGDFTTFITTAAFDYAVVEAPMQVAYLGPGQGIWGFRGEVGPAGWLKRHFFLVKPHYLFIYDELECPYATKYHLNVKADGMKQNGNRVHFDGRLGVDMEFLALDLGDRKIQHGEFDVKMHYAAAFKPPEKFFHQLQMTIDGKPNEHFCTLLVPHKPSENVTVGNDATTGGAIIRRDGAVERTMLFPGTREVRDGNLVFTGQAGAIRENAGELTLIQARGNVIGLSDRIVICGDGPFCATLSRDRLVIETSGIARWLLVEGRMLADVSCDGVKTPVEVVGKKGVRVYVPAGQHRMEMQ